MFLIELISPRSNLHVLTNKAGQSVNLTPKRSVRRGRKTGLAAEPRERVGPGRARVRR